MATTFAPIAAEMAATMGWTMGLQDPLFWAVGFGSALGGIATPFGAVPLLVFSTLSFKDSKLSYSSFLFIALLINIVMIGLCSGYILLLAPPV